MSPARFLGSLLSAICGALFCGCVPSGPGAADEQKEPHFLEGRVRVNAMDYHGAIESFEEALEINPRSSSAHFELGGLYEQRDMDPASAIFHYQSFLKFRPDAPNAEMVRQRIQGLKQVLAGTMSGLPPPAMQREVERLLEENRGLREKLTAYQSSRDAALTNLLRQQPIKLVVTPPGTNQKGPAGGKNPPVTGGLLAVRKHTVQSGESPASIARKYNVKVAALLSANPGLNPTRLKIGQTVNLPAS